MVKKPSIYILPNLLNEGADPQLYFPENLKQVIKGLTGIIGETKKDTIRYLKRFDVDVHQYFIELLNEHSNEDDLDEVMKLIEHEGGDWGIVSDCGMPFLADPGSKLMARLKKKNIVPTIIPGPSSIIYALIQSGLPSQRFVFHGYFPKKTEELEELFNCMRGPLNTYVHLFIEPPYRNNQRLRILKEKMLPNEELTIAIDLTGEREQILTKSMRKWGELKDFVIEKVPCVFVLGKLTQLKKPHDRKNQTPFRSRKGDPHSKTKNRFPAKKKSRS